MKHSAHNGGYAKASKFQYLHRGYDRTLVLAPGWGFDARVFEPLDLDFNYIVPQKIDTANFNEDLIRALERNGIKKVSLFGWSMGGFLALDFLKEYGEIVREVFLVSMRERYPKEQIDSQRSLLMEDRKLYLAQFYRNCFMGQKRPFKWFEEHLFSSYIKGLDLEYLLKGLDYLARQGLDPALLKRHPVRLIHGKKDRIAPYSGILELTEGLPSSHVVLFEKSGHLPFLEPDFKERLFTGSQFRGSRFKARRLSENSDPTAKE